MAHRYELAITSREAASLGDAFALVRKMERALEPAITHAGKLAPHLGWTTDVRKRLRKSFVGWGALTVSSTIPGTHGVSFGAYWDDETAETWAGVRVWYETRNTTLLANIVKAADAGALPGTWERAPQREGAALLRSERLAAIGDLDAVGAWFRGGLDELHAAGILEFISTPG